MAQVCIILYVRLFKYFSPNTSVWISVQNVSVTTVSLSNIDWIYDNAADRLYVTVSQTVWTPTGVVTL